MFPPYWHTFGIKSDKAKCKRGKILPCEQEMDADNKAAGRCYYLHNINRIGSCHTVQPVRRQIKKRKLSFTDYKSEATN